MLTTVLVCTLLRAQGRLRVGSRAWSKQLGAGFILGFCEGPHFWAHGVQLLRAFVQCFVPWRGMTFGLALRVGRD